MLAKDKVQILSQLIQALDDSVKNMEQFKTSKDVAQFEKYKLLAKDFQSKIEEILKG